MKEIRIPERKQRLLDKYQGENGVLNFMSFVKILKQAWRIRDYLLTKESLKEAKGRILEKVNYSFTFHLQMRS